uniref:M14 family zinc carboxypeptidase n=1 Tax=Flavobacterium sp. TaxID=239 RepID=UPI004048AEA1
MKKYSLIIVCFISLTVFSQEKKSYYDTFFSDSEKEIPVPYLSELKAQKYYTSYKNAKDFLALLAEKHPNIVQISDIGKTQKGNKIPMVMLSLKNGIPDTEKVRVTFIGGIHGNEPISTDGLLYLIHELTEKSEYQHLLEKVILQVLPVVNVDGRSLDLRASYNGTDLNRDLNLLSVPETVNLRKAINLFDPQVVVDFHEFNPNRNDFKEINDCLTSGIDAQFLYTGNLNANPAIREMIKTDFVEPTKLVLQNNNRTVANYASTFWSGQSLHLNLGAISSRSSASNYALQNRISILMELRGVTEREKTIKRRIETSFLTATSYLSIVNKKADEIKK